MIGSRAFRKSAGFWRKLTVAKPGLMSGSKTSEIYGETRQSHQFFV